jgi:hypothetical protein
MTEYTEQPSVEQGFDRKLVFPKIKWLTKARFERLASTSNLTIQPCLFNNPNSSNKDKRVFIGKTIPRQPSPFVFNSLLARPPTAPLTYLNLEQVGNVINERGEWKLRITFRGRTVDIENDFLVLYIDQPDAFYWSSNQNQSDEFFISEKPVAQYALKVAVDQIDNKYVHIGRLPAMNDEPKRPKYYSSSWCYVDGSDEDDAVFGRVDSSCGLMFTPFKGLELGHDRFETLCVKATPAPLQTLCRTVVRHELDYSQTRIKELISVLPGSLVDFLKYPPHLRVGESMLSDEKLVEEEGRFELAIEQPGGELVCRSLENGEKRVVIARDVDLISLHRFHAVFFNKAANRAVTQHPIYESILGYQFFIEWEMSNTLVRFLV